MHQAHDLSQTRYPLGRGYGHDYMRGGEVLGGYGYAAREEYSLSRGELPGDLSRRGPRTDELGDEPDGGNALESSQSVLLP